jgi:F-type H+-transporting ATPase subunit a
MAFLAADWTWFHLIPGFYEADHSVAARFGDTVMAGTPVSSVLHLVLAVLATCILMAFVVLTRARWAAAPNPVEPDGKLTIRDFVETVIDVVLSLGEGVFGSQETARRFLPLIGALAMYILFNNLLGLIPGFAPATDNLNVTIGPALVVFITTHIWGLRENGLHYLQHFLGPNIFGLPLLAPLMIIIEVISHLARPLSLGLRLMGNMTGDHAVLAIFLGLVAIPLLFPIPILMLGTLVCIVQTLVFCLLSMVYIALAIEHSEEAH